MTARRSNPRGINFHQHRFVHENGQNIVAYGRFMTKAEVQKMNLARGERVFFSRDRGFIRTFRGTIRRLGNI